MKYLNKEHTSVQFGNTYFSLESPDNWDSIGDGPTREMVKAYLKEGNKPLPYIEPNPNSAILDQIAAIEAATLMNRGAREGWMDLIRERAAAQGVTDDKLIAAANPFFKRLMEVDNQVRALRSQLV